MVTKGLVQEEISAKWMIGSTIVIFFVLRLLLPQVSLVWIIIGVSFVWWGLYRSDLWTTLHRGRWWWEENPEPLTLSEELISFLVVVGMIALAIVVMILVS
jgi:hypothetical protein